MVAFREEMTFRNSCELGYIEEFEQEEGLHSTMSRCTLGKPEPAQRRLHLLLLPERLESQQTYCAH